jgi:hypothetical protein
MPIDHITTNCNRYESGYALFTMAVATNGWLFKIELR